MFTGIIAAAARVRKNEKQKDGGFKLAVAKPRGWRVKKGESIAVDGVCLTAVSVSANLAFEYIPETAARATTPNLRANDVVNLEQAMRLADRLDGHIVQGHVDGVGNITALTAEGNSFILKITPDDASIMRWVAEKGSVTIDGISLTVVEAADAWFTVNIIPHTWKETGLNKKKAGDKVNIEADVLAKYLEKLYANKK